MGASRNKLMSNGGKRLKELIRQHGFRLGAVTEAILRSRSVPQERRGYANDVAPSTMDRWTDNAPIGKLVKLSKFTGIPLMDVINCIEVARIG
jgi:hypothetical protein